MRRTGITVNLLDFDFIFQTESVPQVPQRWNCHFFCVSHGEENNPLTFVFLNLKQLPTSTAHLPQLSPTENTLLGPQLCVLVCQ